MVIIIGAGISGLTAALHIKKPYLILEKEDRIGGLSTQYFSGGYRFDYGGHYFHFKDKAEIKTYLEGFARFSEYRRKSSVFLLGRYIPFPIQSHLSFLPGPLKKKILAEILGSPGQGGASLGQHLENNFGHSLYELFFKPFLSKYYGRDPGDMAANMDKGSIPVPDKAGIIAGAKGQRFSGLGYNPHFFYPTHGLKRFIEGYAAPVRDRVRLDTEVLAIDIDNQQVRTNRGVFSYSRLISTMPLKDLLNRIEPNGRFPSSRHLQHISTLVVNVVLRHKRKRFHWVYLPEKEFPFYRIGFYPARGIIKGYLEKTVTDPAAAASPHLFAEIVFSLQRLGLIGGKEEILHYSTRFIPVSYIIFDRHWPTLVPPLLSSLKNQAIYSIGRYGAWDYTSMSDDVKTAMAVAANL